MHRAENATFAAQSVDRRSAYSFIISCDKRIFPHLYEPITTMNASPTLERSRETRVFLVENHRDTLKYLAMFLGLLGYSVQSARTMKEALSKIAEANCDILISDIGLPDGNGLELLQRITVTRPVYAISISGFGTEADIAKSKAAGFRHHIIKPFGGEDLLPYLDEAVRALGI